MKCGSPDKGKLCRERNSDEGESEMKLVSVIVPVYKVENYLERCVDSILAQTYKELEIILVDDGSPDRCGEICEQYASRDARIRVIHKANGGLSDARNVGVKHASGEYLLFVDSDDSVAPDLVEKTEAEAERTGCDLVLFDYIRLEDDGTREVCHAGLPEHVEMTLEKYPQILINSALSAWSKLYRREFYIKAEHDFPKGRLYEDLGTIPKLYLDAESIVYIKEAFYYYTIRKGSIMSGTRAEKNYTDRTAMLRTTLDYYRQKGVFEKYKTELEYFSFGAGYFEPSKEIILADRKSPYIKKFRIFMYGMFPEFKKNPYMARLRTKDRIHLAILDTRQYWIMVMLSQMRHFAARLCTRQ